MTTSIGILGFAHGHVNSYIGAWSKMGPGRVRVVAGWDHDDARLAKAAEQHGVATETSAKAAAERDDLDAVVIAAETSMHAELVEIAAAAGKKIILQKPMALILAEADRIVDAVKKGGVDMTLAWQMRVDPQNLQIKRLIDEGAIGRVFMMRRRHGLSTHVWGDWFTQSWHVKPELNRGMWADDAAHPIDLALWLFGRPRTTMAEIDTLHDPRVPDDHGIAIFRYDDGKFVEISSSFCCVAGENTTEVVGEKGVIIQNHGDAPSCNVPRPEGAPGLKWYLHDTGEWTCSDLPTPDQHGERIAMLAEPLVAFLEGRRDPIATADEGRESLRMMLSTYESARQGRRIALSEMGRH